MYRTPFSLRFYGRKDNLTSSEENKRVLHLHFPTVTQSVLKLFMNANIILFVDLIGRNNHLWYLLPPPNDLSVNCLFGVQSGDCYIYLSTKEI